jgi:hypothetical protein
VKLVYPSLRFWLAGRVNEHGIVNFLARDVVDQV